MNVSLFTSSTSRNLRNPQNWNPPNMTAANPAALKAVLKNEKAARDFEAMLLTPVLDSLQRTFAGNSGDDNIPGASDYRQMATAALAQAIAARGGIGIAQLILRHFDPPKVSGGS